MSKLDSHADVSDIVEENFKPQAQETDDIQTKNNKIVKLNSQFEGVSKIVEGTIEQSFKPEVEETGAVQTKNGAEPKFDSEMEVVDNAVDSIEAGFDNTQKLDDARTENDAEPTLVSEMEDVSTKPQAEFPPSGETHTTKSKTVATKIRALKTPRKVCTEAGVTTRARSSIRMIKNEDVLYLSDAGKSSPSVRKRRKGVTDEELSW